MEVAVSSLPEQGTRVGDTTFVRVVFDMEADVPMPIGLYERTEESTVVYRDHGGYGDAPEDCVAVVLVGIRTVR